MKNNKNPYYITLDDIRARSTPGAVKVLEGSSGGKMPNITHIIILNVLHLVPKIQNGRKMLRKFEFRALIGPATEGVLTLHREVGLG